MSVKARLFLILFIAGFIGIASFLFIDLNALVALLPEAVRKDAPPITLALKLLSLVQPTLFLGVAILLGVTLAPRVGLKAPVAESLAARQPLRLADLGLVPGILGGAIGAAVIVLCSVLARPALGVVVVRRIGEFGALMPLPTRFLYGGITEELLLRWGFMTLVVWAMWRLLEKRLQRPSRLSFVVAILTSALLFGAGHLPIAIMLFSEVTFPLIAFVIVANSAFGVVAGFLYWRRGLESAIVAHMFCHLFLATASYLGMYF